MATYAQIAKAGGIYGCVARNINSYRITLGRQLLMQLHQKFRE
jgi:hypothetical protein